MSPPVNVPNCLKSMHKFNPMANEEYSIQGNKCTFNQNAQF